MAATVTTKSARTAARQAARQAATAAQEAIAARTRLNTEDLATFFSAQERSHSVDQWLAERIAAAREQADDRRVEHRRAAGAALAAMRKRGETVREIARMAGIGEKTARELMRCSEVVGLAVSGAAESNGAGGASNDAAGPNGSVAGHSAAGLSARAPAAS